MATGRRAEKEEEKREEDKKRRKKMTRTHRVGMTNWSAKGKESPLSEEEAALKVALRPTKMVILWLLSQLCFNPCWKAKLTVPSAWCLELAKPCRQQP